MLVGILGVMVLFCLVGCASPSADSAAKSLFGFMALVIGILVVISLILTLGFGSEGWDRTVELWEIMLDFPPKRAAEGE